VNKGVKIIIDAYEILRSPLFLPAYEIKTSFGWKKTKNALNIASFMLYLRLFAVFVSRLYRSDFQTFLSFD